MKLTFAEVSLEQNPHHPRGKAHPMPTLAGKCLGEVTVADLLRVAFAAPVSRRDPLILSANDLTVPMDEEDTL